MQQQLFEYAVIRFVPRVEREEFVNIGVIVFGSKLKFLQTRYLLDEQRLTSFFAGIDIELLRENVCAFERICQGDKAAGPIGKLDIASRFRWLTATRSTVIQTSKVHPGLSTDLQKTLDTLFEQLVLL
jgi:hypothetical protein